MKGSALACLLLAGGGLSAQVTVVPEAAPQLSPDAAYAKALRPFDIVRRSVANWSDSETGAFAAAMKEGGLACKARAPEQFTGDDLISYAKLCSLGQKWDVMGAAAARYIDSDDVLKPQLATAYGYKLESEIHAGDVIGIVGIHQAMMASVPYDAVVETVSNEAAAYLQTAYTSDALGLLRTRQDALLEALKGDKPMVPRAALYTDGLALAALEQYAGEADAAKATVAALDGALGETLKPDDAIPVEIARRRYGLLGRPLPEIVYELSLLDVREKPHINQDFGAGTALLLFPPWCAQCVRMTPEIWDAMTRLKEQEIRVYGLVAEALPDRAKLLTAQMKPMTPPPADAPVRTPSETMLHMPVLVVPEETLGRFAAEDYPFLVMVDHAGVVRFAEAAPETAMRPGDLLDRVALHVAEQWPRVGKAKAKNDAR